MHLNSRFKTSRTLTISIMGILVFWFFLCAAEDAAALTVSPARQTAIVDAGAQGEAELTISNDSEETKTYLPQVDAFAIDSKTGRAIFGQPDTAIDWVNAGVQEMELGPGETEVFRFQIDVPEDATTGSHYLALFAGEKPAPGQIGVSARAGSLLFLYVSGDVYEDLSVDKFSFDSRWYGAGPARLNLRLRNTGTIHLTPVGYLKIIDESGVEISRLTINDEQRKILPGGFWEEEYLLDKEILGPAAGKVVVEYSITYGVSEKQASGNTSFWYLPVWAWGMAAGAAVFLISLVTIVVMVLKKRAKQK